MKTKGTSRISTKRKVAAEVALNSPTHREDLPYPYVHYPNHYGTFISFSETAESTRYFCACSRQAIENYLQLHQIIEPDGKLNSKWGLDHAFSNFYVGAIRQATANYKNVFHYKEGLCHRCTGKTPDRRWCVEMYGSNFKQYFGWYIGQTRYHMAFFRTKYLPERTDPEIAQLLNPYKDVDILKLIDRAEEYERYCQTMKALEVLVENTARKALGFRSIGDGWVNETIMCSIIVSILQPKEILRRYRPAWLAGLELDAFCPELNLAFEYQGKQHYTPIEAWGGQEAFDQLKERDKRKKELCQQHGIKLIEVAYYELLTEQNIRDKIETVTTVKDLNHDKT